MTKPAKLSRKAAIDAKCKDCIYDNLAPGTWRKQVEECPCVTCPLWSSRPVSKGVASE